MPRKAFILMIIGGGNLIPSIIFSSLMFLFPPVFMMGMVSPLIINKLAIDISQTGKISGNVYAISTLGGIMATFTIGFYVIPMFGLTFPAIMTGVILGLIPVLVLVNQKIFGSLFFVLLCIWAFSKEFLVDFNNSKIKVLKYSEGLNGQALVVDQPNYNENSIVTGYTRMLYVNRIAQTMLNMEPNSANKHFMYVDKICHLLNKFPEKSKVLVLGLGGGSVANELSNKKFIVEACELDERVAAIAKEYFFLSDSVKIIIDDARHFIKYSINKYDIIIVDVFKGEETPNHIITLESIVELKKRLSPTGMLIINGNGFISGTIGKGMRSICKTLMNSNFNTQIVSSGKEEASRNLLFIATLNETIKIDNCDYISLDSIDLNDAIVLKDDFPTLDILNLQASMSWRHGYIKTSTKEYAKENIPLFQ